MRKLLMLSVPAAFAASVALAQLPAFEEVDENGDGMIDREEAAAVEGLQFEVMDVDGDGSIDREEWAEATGEGA